MERKEQIGIFQGILRILKLSLGIEIYAGKKLHLKQII
jgi:hypothetical protein